MQLDHTLLMSLFLLCTDYALCLLYSCFVIEKPCLHIHVVHKHFDVCMTHYPIHKEIGVFVKGST